MSTVMEHIADRQSDRSGNQATKNVGFWSALLSAGLALAWAAALAIQVMVAPPAPWTGIEDYARSFKLIQMLNLIPALPVGWAFVVMMAALHLHTPEEKKVFSLCGLAFTILYAVLANVNYLIQVVMVRPSLLAGELEGLGLWVGDNPHSVFMALANAYPIQCIGLFFAAWALGKGARERWIRGLWIALGSTVPFQFTYSLGLLPMAIGLPVLRVWIVGAPVSCFMLAALFKQQSKVTG